MATISLPDLDHPQWRRLVTGQSTHKFAVASAGMMFMRLQRRVAADDADAAVDAACAEARAYCEKYRAILGDDIAAIFG